MLIRGCHVTTLVVVYSVGLPLGDGGHDRGEGSRARAAEAQAGRDGGAKGDAAGGEEAGEGRDACSHQVLSLLLLVPEVCALLVG